MDSWGRYQLTGMAIPHEKAADLAGCNRLGFMDILAQKGIVIFDYDESIADSELRGVAQLSKGAA